jgi:hypothetical protein
MARLQVAQAQAAFTEEHIQPRRNHAFIALIGRALDGRRCGFQPVFEKIGKQRGLLSAAMIK